MKRKLAFACGAIGAVIGFGGGAVVMADKKDNDRVLNGEEMEFIEVFRQDNSRGDKNYQYTITEFTDAHGRDCTVVSGDSEKTIALDCDRPRG
jgi:hypothetical protein